MKGRQGKVAFSSNVVNNTVREWNLGQGPPTCELLKELCHEIYEDSSGVETAIKLSNTLM